MYDDKQYPYRCPLCLIRPSTCTEEANTGLKTVGCLTCDCPAPVFVEDKSEKYSFPGLSKYIPLIKWDKWVINYRKEHPNWHREAICNGCLKYNATESCINYNPDCIRCAEAKYPEEE